MLVLFKFLKKFYSLGKVQNIGNGGFLRSCVRDGSGNPFCLFGIVFRRPMVKDKKIAADSPTRAVGNAVARDTPKFG